MQISTWHLCVIIILQSVRSNSCISSKLDFDSGLLRFYQCFLSWPSANHSYILLSSLTHPHPLFYFIYMAPLRPRKMAPPPRDRHDLQYTRIWAGHVATRLTLHPGRGVPATVVFVYGNSHPLFSFFFSTPQEAWEAKACTVFVNNGTRIKHHHEVVEVFFFFK